MSKALDYLEQFEPHKAFPLLMRAAKKEPTYQNLINYAVAQRGCGLIEQAQRTIQKAMAIDHSRPEAWSNMGQVYEDLGQFDDAPALFQRALQCIDNAGTPLHSAGEPLLAFAYSMMRLGHFKFVWPVWERARMNRSWFPFQGLPLWTQQPGARLLILPEGGFGDGFNFLRWVPRLPLAKATILIWDSMFEYAKYTLDTGQPSNSGIEVLPMSHVFQFSELQRFTHCAPYLSLMTGMESWDQIPPPLNWEPRGRIVASPNDWIGFAWRAEEAGVMRKTRTLDKLAADRLGKYLSGRCEKVVGLCPKGKSLYRPEDGEVPKGVDQDDAMLAGWEETALTLLKCKLVISVDTAIYHLAASLGIPTILLLPMRSDWKHGKPGEPDRWYGGRVKLVRNTHPVDWTPTIEEVKKLV